MIFVIQTTRYALFRFSSERLDSVHKDRDTTLVHTKTPDL